MSTLGFDPTGGKKKDDPKKDPTKKDPPKKSATFGDMMGSGGNPNPYGSTIGGDFYTQQFRAYGLPDGWTWIPASGSQAEVFVGDLHQPRQQALW